VFLRFIFPVIVFSVVVVIPPGGQHVSEASSMLVENYVLKLSL
jgi:hypothetical protein